MTTITIDSLPEEEFRQAIESDLRHGRASQAVARLRGLLAPYAGPGGILPERFLSVTSDDLVIKGWDYLGDCIARHDRPGRPVTAIAITYGWAGDDAPGPDEAGLLHPHVETAYFNDSAYPFSKSGRDDLLDGYSLHGCTWAADSEAVDNALSVDGIDDLHGALALLERELLASDEPDEEAVRAGSLGASLLSALLFEAVSAQIKAKGLPRPVCVTAGSNGVYPYFDAPIVGMPEQVRQAAVQAEEEEELVDAGVPGPRYSSLLLTGIPRAQKRAVLVLSETESEMAVRLASLRGGDAEAELPPAPEPVAPREVQGSPLLAKKSGHSGGWDFRDMLGPPPEDRGPQPPVDEPPHDAWLDDFGATLPEPEPEPAPEAERPWFDEEWDMPAPPAAAPEAAEQTAFDDSEPQPEPQPQSPASVHPPRLPSLPVPEPGFSLVDADPAADDPAASLQSRLDALIAPPVTEPEPMPEPLPALVIADPWPIEQAGLAWPFGPEPIKSAPPEEPARPAPRPGIWAQIKAWWNG